MHNNDHVLFTPTIIVNHPRSAMCTAREHQWLGEVSALEESLVHLRRRRDEVQQLRTDSSPIAAG